MPDCEINEPVQALKGKWKSHNCVWLFVIPWSVACLAPQAMEFSRQGYWSGLPFPSQGLNESPKVLQAQNVLLGWGFPHSPVGKESACSSGHLGLIPGLGRSPGERTGNPLQYPCLENPMDSGAWQATVNGVAKSWTWVSDWHFSYTKGSTQHTPCFPAMLS